MCQQMIQRQSEEKAGEGAKGSTEDQDEKVWYIFTDTHTFLFLTYLSLLPYIPYAGE